MEVDVALGLRERELDTLADLRGLRGDGEVGKVLERKRRVGRGALLEEGSGKREDLRALERGVDWRNGRVRAISPRQEQEKGGIQGDGVPSWPWKEEMRAWWRASTVRMAPA